MTDPDFRVCAAAGADAARQSSALDSLNAAVALAG
jgi:hypothetical protein